MDTFTDYYALLHVQADAPMPVIKASYRAMMQKLGHHPDKGGDVSFAQRLNAAVKVLCDPATRAAYDALRTQHISQSSPSQSTSSKSHDGQTRAESWSEPGGSPRRPEPEPEPEPPPQRKEQPYSNSVSTALPANLQCPFCHASYNGTAVVTGDSASSYVRPTRCSNCNGAKTSISQLPDTSNAELRRVYRHTHETDASVWHYWPSDADTHSKLADFSPAGCALFSTNAIGVGKIVMIETDLFNAICRVRHSRKESASGYSIGLEFITLDMLATRGALLDSTA